VLFVMTPARGKEDSCTEQRRGGRKKRYRAARTPELSAQHSAHHCLLSCQPTEGFQRRMSLTSREARHVLFEIIPEPLAVLRHPHSLTSSQHVD
jgi:hypothetical protein